jgi:hypothetical protein
MTISTNPARLERWLGRDKVEHLSRSMRGWYGPPIGVHGVPGAVFATGDGDFIGECREGYEASAYDYAEDLMRRLRRASRIASGESRTRLNTGFASLSDLISKVTQSAQRQELFFHKVGPTGVANVTSSLWRMGDLPQAGAAGSAAPGGRACTSSTAGAFSLVNAPGGTTQHFINGNVLGTLVNTLLLYDRIFDVAKSMASTATEAVTGVPTRYQSVTNTDPNYIGGNFGFIEVGGTPLAATAHNWTTCQYVKEDGSTTQSLPSLTGNSGAIVDRLDHPTGQWYAPLVAGDVGMMKWTQMQCSASVATGLINFVIGHPLVWMPCSIAQQLCIIDGINTAFNLVRIFDSACLAMLEVLKPAATATTYTGSILMAQG